MLKQGQGYLKMCVEPDLRSDNSFLHMTTLQPEFCRAVMTKNVLEWNPLPHIHQIWLPKRCVSKIKVYLTGTKISEHWRRSQVWWQGWRLFRNNSTNVTDSDINLWGTCTLLKLANLKMMSLINRWVYMSACNKTSHGNIITTPGTDQQIFSTTAWRGRPPPPPCYIFQRNPFSTFKRKHSLKEKQATSVLYAFTMCTSTKYLA